MIDLLGGNMGESQGVSRRDLVKGAGLLGVSALGAGLLAGCATDKSSASGTEDRTWDKETDVLVVGYGGAGSNAAIAAHDAGAEVLIIEKMPIPGGNTIYSLGGWICPTSSEETYTYIRELFEVSHYIMDEEVVRMFSDEVIHTSDWIKELDDSLEIEVYGGSGFPDLEGAGSQNKCRIVPKDGQRTGDALFGTYVKAVEQDRGIEVMLETPATELIVDSSGTVLGCLAANAGEEIAIKARKAVILTCGSFEYDESLKLNSIKGWPLFALGNPGNSGDGIRMAQKVGADLWHMNVCVTQLGHKNDTCESAYKLGFTQPGYFWVNESGKRFCDEPSVEAHSILNIMDIYDADPKVLEYPNNPIYLIFDDQARLAGPICSSYAYSRNVHTWSKDNSEEIELGWIKKADTFEDLATQLGLDPAILTETAQRFNELVASGTDSDYGRAIKTTDLKGNEKNVSEQLANAPFYGIELGCAIFHCGGGPRRNAKGQIVDPFREPIPHLYSAGEMGTMWGSIYQGAGMNAEAMVTGRIAGTNAAAETAV